MAPTVSYSLLQQGQQITRNDFSWTTLGTSADVTFGFRASTPAAGNEAATFGRFNANEVLATRIALQEWSDVANIRFADPGGGGYTDNATMLFANFTGGPNSAGHAYLPVFKNLAPTSPEGDTWLNLTASNYNNFAFGSFDFSTIVHEIGHAIGLSHPGDYNAGDEGVPATYQTSAQYIQDSKQFTIMSYFLASNTGANFFSPDAGVAIAASTPLLADIMAAQRLYGATTTTRTGDNIYGFNSNSGDQYRISAANPQVVFTIYDNGGTNTLDLSGYANNQVIDLRQGEFSNAGALTKNISIAPGTVVQNARGGSGSDAILGNASDNAIFGGAGNDQIDGGAGINSAIYSGHSGNYTVTLRAGPGPATATVLDRTGVDGTDTVTNVQHLRFTDTTLSSAGTAVSLSGEPAASSSPVMSDPDVTQVLGAASLPGGLAASSSPVMPDLDLTQVLEAASLSPASFSDLAQVFIATLYRAPDALGLDYWAGRLVEGASLREVAAGIYGSSEARTLLPVTLGAGDFVAAAYNLALGRAPDAAGLAYWTGVLQTGQVARDGFILDLVLGARNSAADAAHLANRAAVGEHFALTKGINDLLQAVTVMADVDADPGSVTRAIAAIDKFAAADALASDELIIAITGIVP